MKILHISGAKVWGGNEQQMIYYIPELSKLGIENIVLGIKDSPLEKECLLNNITYIPTKNNSLKGFVNYRYLKKLVEELKPDVIHLHTSNSLTFYVFSDLMYKLKTKAIFSKKAISASSSFFSSFKYNYSGIDSIFCVSKSVETNFQEMLWQKNKYKTDVINDCVSLDIIDAKAGINLREKYSIDKAHFIIGNIANHTDAKDLDTFINVVDYLVHSLERKDIIFFQIGGFSKLTDNFLDAVKEKQLENYIVFTDKIQNAFSLNSQFDVFLMTSQREGGPTSVLEAMLIGTPVVSTKVGVVPDAIQNGVNGFISPVKDYKDLAAKIDSLLSDKVLRDEFIKNGKVIILKEFTSSFIAKQMFLKYKKMM
ncbi:glycosyltransferase family 4 protein [Flavobacterium sp. XS2P24]|uniref:glycosyltransferase family 4 protein n=1 Tax=Flavobacterium sp. XS2P24 TaxID=3041249 RepID=UPI0024A9939B|nr:glycosyltransferase family 4 protein [Flavobacterium sp. XS2P24]MDI6050230.1 glycosyltransferase family 4 protein [Flavobacterium sp. XS2P24]